MTSVIDLDNSPSAYDDSCNPASETCGYMLGPSSDYLGGHIVVWLVAVINSFVPFFLFWFWKRPMFNDDTQMIDKDFKKAWKWLGWGMFASFVGPAVIWPFTFLYNNYLQIVYLELWGWPGYPGALAVDFAVIILLIKSAPSVKAAWNKPDPYGGEHDYDGVDAFEKEVWTSLGVFIASQGLLAFVAFWFFRDTVIFMLPRSLKKYLEDKGKTESFGSVEYDF